MRPIPELEPMNKKLKPNIEESNNEWFGEENESNVSIIKESDNEKTESIVENDRQNSQISKSFTEKLSHKIINEITMRSLTNQMSTKSIFNYELQNTVYHYRHENTSDHSLAANVNVWKSCFMPRLMSNIIATCGGSVSALINCERTHENQVMATFKSPQNDEHKNEELLSVATTALPVEHNGEHELCNVLAIGGKCSVYLCREPNFDKPYETLIGYTDAVNALVIDSSKPNWLFSSSLEKAVIIWQIGSLFREKEEIKHNSSAIIYKYSVPFGLISMSYISEHDCLVACGQSNALLVFKEISSFK